MNPWRSIAIAVVLSVLLANPVAAQAPAAISGQVTSTEEGPMEGVLVTARRDGAQFAVSVSTNERGVYTFPESRLAPGKYSLQIRAVGYELERPATTDIAAARTATLDLTLRKTTDLSLQLTSTEWFMSWPGTEAQKEAVYSCTNCHSVDRIARSRHNAEEWLQVFVRMASYANMTTDAHPQKRVTAPNPGRFGAEIRNLAAYLATVNLSATPEWTYEFKTLPRIKGRGNRAIVTEYFLPRAQIQPHDVLVDADGIVWYSNFGELNLGRFDPKTGELKEYPLPLHRPGYPQGQLDLEFDRDGNLWMGLMYQGGVAKFDKTNADRCRRGTCPPTRWTKRHSSIRSRSTIPTSTARSGRPMSASRASIASILRPANGKPSTPTSDSRRTGGAASTRWCRTRRTMRGSPTMPVRTSAGSTPGPAW